MSEKQISDFLDRKLERRFRTYDLDGDGFIERSDFQLAVDGMAREYNLSADDKKLQQLTELFLGLWDRLAAAADRDGDGRVTLAEYKTAFNAGMLETPESFDAGYVPFLDAIMDIADVDNDGRLTPVEHARWIKALMSVPAEHAEVIGRRLDADGDGYIDRTEILNAIRAYYFDEAPDSAGSWLLGPLP
ncbi:EF-hand domain-containing protein [Nocardia sp. NPDC051570]|uniref:EF-hand domain-containing protein n=1 Tax=Nocardia sp. NPDC051570 TaxID=3364324 RepID=UPI0037AB9333